MIRRIRAWLRDAMLVSFWVFNPRLASAMWLGGGLEHPYLGYFDLAALLPPREEIK